MNHYDIEVTREDGYWVAVAAGVRGGATESRKLSALEAETRDLLSGLLDVPEDQLELRFNFERALPMSAIKALGSYEDARRDLAVAQREYEASQRDAVAQLRAESVSLRDAAELLGISFQRVQQLEAS